jgi:hypothetical protein
MTLTVSKSQILLLPSPASNSGFGEPKPVAPPSGPVAEKLQPGNTKNGRYVLALSLFDSNMAV